MKILLFLLIFIRWQKKNERKTTALIKQTKSVEIRVGIFFMELPKKKYGKETEA